ncbi:hypothetical protein GCWU000246_00231 [Jonquetella anthropi E3_33 E1]|nr:hypothetical protein GCWU000246_00231 [Jonquetella anthropi E3_33 E1]
MTQWRKPFYSDTDALELEKNAPQGGQRSDEANPALERKRRPAQSTKRIGPAEGSTEPLSRHLLRRSGTKHRGKPAPTGDWAKFAKTPPVEQAGRTTEHCHSLIAMKPPAR